MKQFGLMINEIVFPNLPVILKNAGYDFVIVDGEHGAFDFAQTAAYAMICKLCKIKMIVRVAQVLRKDITRYMDMGADAILLAMTSSSEQIEEAVRYAKYAPLGKRGISTMRAHTLYSPPPLETYMQRANASTSVFAQIETEEGAKCAEQIASVQGVDGIFFGPNDYSCDIGAIGDRERICAAIRDVSEKTLRAGKPCGIITSVEAYQDVGAQSGMTMFSIGSELSILSDGAKHLIAGVRERV